MPAPYRYNKERRNVLGSIWKFFTESDWGLGPVVDTQQRGVAHVHSWEFYNTIRCGWRVEDGRPVGERVGINLAILDKEKNPSKNETKISQLRDWQKSGYEYVHVSQTVYKCKSCDVTKNIDVYAAPVKGNGEGPLIVDNGSRFQKKFTETTRIPVTNAVTRREVAVEPMKRHGVRPKVKKEPPVVPMED